VVGLSKAETAKAFTQIGFDWTDLIPEKVTAENATTILNDYDIIVMVLIILPLDI
jgi:hypothetical protein